MQFRRAPLVQWKLASDGIDLIGVQRFEGKACMRGLTVELREARVADERDDEVALASQIGRAHV